MGKLYIVEGIPGSGKTTFAKKLAEYFRKNNKSVTLYEESDLHPTDMAWCALLKKDEYKSVLEKYPEIRKEIIANSQQWNGYEIVAYTRIHDITPELYGYLEEKEIYDGRIGIETFCQIHENRWKQFGQTADGTYIFECALLQNSLNEMLLFGQQSENIIKEYIIKLLKDVERLHPEIIYLKVDTEEILNSAGAERVNRTGEHVWEDMVCKYIENSPWGKEHDIHGVDGMHEYYAFRQWIEMEIIKQVPAKTHVLNLDLNQREDYVDHWIKNNIVFDTLLSECV